MAEAVVGLLASIVQLAELTLKVCDYADQVRNAPAEKAAISREAALLFTMLTRLRHRVGMVRMQNDTSTTAWITRAPVIQPAMDELKTDLGTLLNRLEHGRLLWPWDARKCQQTLARIQRVQNMVQLDLLENFTDKTEQSLTSIDQSVRTLVDEHESNWWRKLREYFSDTGSSLNQQNVFDRRFPGTGAWVLQHPTFSHWIASVGENLWCPGIPGAGKTIIASIIIDHLEQKFGSDYSVGIAYIYFNYKETRSEMQLLSDIYLQLLQRQQTVPSLTRTYIDRYQREGKRPSCKDLKDLIQAALKLYSRSFVVLDALDECSGNRDQPLEVQGQLGRTFYETLRSFGPFVNLLVTSRVSGDLPQLFRGTMRLDISPHEGDMINYVEERIRKAGNGNLPQWVKMCQEDAAFKNLSISKIIEKAQKMFLMVRFHVDALMAKSRVAQVQKALEDLPTQLFENYEDAMVRIANQSADQRDRARRVLTWIAFAFRPLTINELQHAEATAIAEFTLDERDVQSIEALVSCCAGLVVSDSHDNTVRFVHYTTQEFFQARQSHFPQAHKYMTQTCLTYLQFETFDAPKNDWNCNRLLESYPFIRYAACFWGHHANEKGRESNSVNMPEKDEEVQNLALTLLRKEWRVSDQFYVEPIAGDRNSMQAPRDDLWQDSGRPSGLHIAAGFGLESVLLLLLKERFSPELRDDRGYTPLHRAVANGRENTVRLLVEHGADVNARDHRGGLSPLMVAAATSRLSIARFLLDHGAEVNMIATGLDNSTALFEACHFGWTDVVQLLLERGAKTTTAEDGSATSVRWPMVEVAHRGWVDIIQLLLNGGCNLAGPNGYIALRAAIWGRNLACLKALTRATAEDSYTTEGKPTILEHALLQGSWRMIQYLLQQQPNAPTTEPELQHLVIAQLNRVSWFNRTQLTSESDATPNADTAIKRYRRDEVIMYDENAEPATYLALVVPDDVANVQKIVFRSDSHDQGWCDNPAAGTWTWFEASVEGRGEEDQYFRRDFAWNRAGSAEWQLQERSWARDTEDEAVASCVRKIAPGTIIQVIAKARFNGWVNHVRSFELELHYLPRATSPLGLSLSSEG